MKVDGEQKWSCNCTNVINGNTLASLGLVKTVKEWCFKGEEDLVYSSGSTLATTEDHTNFFPETNFERFVADRFRNLNERTLKEKLTMLINREKMTHLMKTLWTHLNHNRVVGLHTLSLMLCCFYLGCLVVYALFVMMALYATIFCW